MTKLFILYAVLLFSKKAPQLIKDLLKISGDNVGLKGLNIKNKLGEAPIVGKHVKSGMEKTGGALKGATGGAIGGLRAPKGQKLKAILGGAASGYQRGKNAAANGDTKGVFGKSYKDSSNVASGGKPSLYSRMMAKPQQLESNILRKISGESDKSFTDPLAKQNNEKLMKIRADLTAKVGANKANQIMALALDDLKKVYGRVDLSDEKQMKFLTEGKVWDEKNHCYRAAGKFGADGKEIGPRDANGELLRDANGKVIVTGEYKGLDAAVKYSGTTDSFKFDSAFEGEAGISTIMNTSYRYANIAGNIDSKYNAYLEAQSRKADAAARGEDTRLYDDDIKKAFSKYCTALKTASDANLIKVDVDIGNKTINGKNMDAFKNNEGDVLNDVKKQVSELKTKTDAMVQKEEVKQKQAKEKAENSADK